MNRLDRYVFRTVLGSVAMVMVVLMLLASLFLFFGQQDDIGVGTYSAVDALWFVLLNLPQSAWELLPIGVLIGSLTGLGALARGSELTIMRVSGISVWRFAGSTLLAGLVLALIGTLLGDWLAPPLQQLAKQQKAFNKFDSISFAGRGGAWVRDGDRLLNVAQQSSRNSFDGMMIFELSSQNRLRSIGRAKVAQTDASGRWSLTQYQESRFEGDSVQTTQAPTRSLDSSISAEFLAVAASDPAQLDTQTLYRLIDNLRANEVNADSAVFAFWSRIARNVAIVFAALLAVPFVFGSLRAAGSGARTLLGLLLGVGFFLLQQTLESGAVVFNLNPIVTAWIPAALMGASALLLIARTR